MLTGEGFTLLAPDAHEVGRLFSFSEDGLTIRLSLEGLSVLADSGDVDDVRVLGYLVIELGAFRGSHHLVVGKAVHDSPFSDELKTKSGDR